MNPVETITEALAPNETELMSERAAICAPDQPITIYEVHMPSWMRVPEEENRALTFFELAPKLSEHVKLMNFTHVQLHAPGYTDPKGLRFLTEYLHKQDIGVILDAGQSNTSPALKPDDMQADGQCTGGETHLFGHDYKWDDLWAQDAEAYFATDPLYRKFRHAQFRRRDGYAFDANYILPLSHQLVTRPRQSLLAGMPGDDWQKFANLRLLYAYAWLSPGKKLLFMGNEFGQLNPWQPETSLDWHLLNGAGFHSQLMKWVAALNRFYREEHALYETDSSISGFQWIDTSDAASSVISFLRQSPDTGEVLLTVLNFTPIPRQNYRVGVPV